MKKDAFIAAGILTLCIVLTWYSDIMHLPEEPIYSLIGKDYYYARNDYFEDEPDQQYQINLNNDIGEFHGGILTKVNSITDSIVDVYTWESLNHKTTIWVGKTQSGSKQIIDALRYKNSVRY